MPLFNKPKKSDESGDKSKDMAVALEIQRKNKRKKAAAEPAPEASEPKAESDELIPTAEELEMIRRHRAKQVAPDEETLSLADESLDDELMLDDDLLLDDEMPMDEESEEDAERPDSIASAIVKKRKKMADGGIVTSEPGIMDDLNMDALGKENTKHDMISAIRAKAKR